MNLSNLSQTMSRFTLTLTLSDRGIICGHTVVTNVHHVQQTTLNLCGHCTHTCGSGHMYKLVCAHPSSPKALPRLCSVYQMGV